MKFIKTDINKKCSKGFSLIEMIIVIAIIGILSAVAVSTYGGIIKQVKTDTCNVNCTQLERMYEMHLELNDIKHSKVLFEEFLKEYGKEICPDGGEIIYVDGKIKCCIHSSQNEEIDEKKDDGAVPFL